MLSRVFSRDAIAPARQRGVATMPALPSFNWTMPALPSYNWTATMPALPSYDWTDNSFYKASTQSGLRVAMAVLAGTILAPTGLCRVLMAVVMRLILAPLFSERFVECRHGLLLGHVGHWLEDLRQQW